MFALSESNESCIDTSGNTWTNISGSGWRRQEDEFFWPCDPQNNNNIYRQYPPTIEKVAKTRSIIE